MSECPGKRVPCSRDSRYRQVCPSPHQGRLRGRAAPGSGLGPCNVRRLCLHSRLSVRHELVNLGQPYSTPHIPTPTSPSLTWVPRHGPKSIGSYRPKLGKGYMIGLLQTRVKEDPSGSCATEVFVGVSRTTSGKIVCIRSSGRTSNKLAGLISGAQSPR